MKRITVNLPDDLAADVADLARAWGTSESAILHHAFLEMRNTQKQVAAALEWLRNLPTRPEIPDYLAEPFD